MAVRAGGLGEGKGEWIWQPLHCQMGMILIVITLVHIGLLRHTNTFASCGDVDYGHVREYFDNRISQPFPRESCSSKRPTPNLRAQLLRTEFAVSVKRDLGHYFRMQGWRIFARLQVSV